jgi:NADH-quinone oxidoreductase subunit E
MPRFSPENAELAHEILGHYPVAKSATIPLCHLAQEQDGHLTDDAMEHIAELVGCSPAEVLGTASFYEMFKREPVGRYVINVCTSISCFLMGGDELLHHAEETLGIKAGGTTADGLFTLEGYECIAACTEAPCLQVNYRYFHKIANDEFDRLVDDLRAGRLEHDIPPHGTLQRRRQHMPADRRAGVAPPNVSVEPVWLRDEPALPDTTPAATPVDSDGAGGTNGADGADPKRGERGRE